jgi:Zn-dependent protease
MDLDPALIRDGLITFILLVASIALHEWGHALAADLLGDDTPQAHGRVTLNPMAHLDWVGTVIIPLINIFFFRSGFTFIGWGKPVLINPSNFRNRVRDEILVALAGPVANLLAALAAILVGALVVGAQPRLAELVRGIVIMNVGLAVFNMLPFPPLDGATLLRRIVGMSEETYFAISRWSGLVMLIVINLSVTQQLIIYLVGAGCIPYLEICRWINPSAARLVFPS